MVEPSDLHRKPEYLASAELCDLSSYIKLQMSSCQTVFMSTRQNKHFGGPCGPCNEKVSAFLPSELCRRQICFESGPPRWSHQSGQRCIWMLYYIVKNAFWAHPGVITMICYYRERLLDPSPGPQLSNHRLATRTRHCVPWNPPHIEAACTAL